MSPFSGLALLLVASAQATAPSIELGLTEPPDAPTRLARATSLLDSDRAGDRRAAVAALVSLASRWPELPAEIEELLWTATGDPDPRVAGLATRMLQRRESPLDASPAADERVRALSEARRLRWAVETLSQTASLGEPPTDRFVAAQAIADLATRASAWSPDLAWAVAELHQDTDPEVALMAEKILARFEGRPIDPASVPRRPRPQDPTPQLERDRRADAAFEATADPDPAVRLTALHWVVDVALSEGDAGDPRIATTLSSLRADADPRVSELAREALAALSRPGS